MSKLVIPVAKVDDDDVGQVSSVTGTEGTIAIATGGHYKIAAMGQPLLWKLGSTAVTITSGSYLAAGDQENIYVPDGGDTLRFILSSDSGGDGEINLVVTNIREIPGVDPRQYDETP